MALESRTTAEKEKQRAAASSVLAAVFLTLFKIVVGLLTGSLGILSEAAHSGLDLVAALVTFFAVRFSDRPADAEHPYGHGKIENLSALIETLLLLLTCVWIIYEVVQRLFFKHVAVEVNLWAFLVMVTSVVIDISRARVLYAAARKYNSPALEADALHFSTDVWSSLTVIGGLALVSLSGRLGSEWAWLAKADAVAALLVALIVIYVSVRLGREAIAVLLDAAPPFLTERIGNEVADVPGVQTVGAVRVRQSGASTFVDLGIGVDRSLPLEKAHQVAAMVEKRIAALVRRGDVMVHVAPVPQSDESLPQTVSAIVGRFGLRAHNVHAHQVRGEYFVSLHVEVDADMLLGEAHAMISRLEVALCQELPHIQEINTHIEPIHTLLAPNELELVQGEAGLRTQILALVEEMPDLSGCHNVHFWSVQDGYHLTLHCLADPQTPVGQAHRLADELERQIRARMPDISQVLVHTEPEGGKLHRPCYE